MGDKRVTSDYDENEMRRFTAGVLADLQALEKMLEGGLFENDVRRIGAEQELFLVDAAMRPAPLAIEVIEEAEDPRLTTEIGRFNLEANLTPRLFAANALGAMENELNEVLGIVRCAAQKFDAGVVMAGILPTIQLSDLKAANLTPHPRYHEIDRVVTMLHGKNRVIQIKGLDELHLTLQDTFIEFCNTSFQIHLQVPAKDFVRYYNWSQAIAAPVLASAVNSPFLLNHRLWHETRLALFQHAIDTRSLVHRERNQPPRVCFGDRWVDSSIIEVLREDAVRFRILLTQTVEENSLDVLANGGIPKLESWRLHNGTIWRWNRPCYGITDGKAGLRIEARYLPAGPSVPDQMANAAFFLGLMTELPEEFGDIREFMTFDEAKANFFNAARYGLSGQIRGLDGQSRRVGRIILEELLPRAADGLTLAGIDEADGKRLLGIIEARVSKEMSGARWMLDSYSGMDPRAKSNVRVRTLTAAMKKNQEAGLPVHDWDLAEIPRRSEWIDNYKTVEQFMAVDLFTVRPGDIVDLAASLMHWRHVRHVPVEDDSGRLIGIVSHRDIIELFAMGKITGPAQWVVRDIMRTDLVTISPETGALDALELMREKNIGCLPVIKDQKLVGLVTAYDFLTVSTKIFEERMAELASRESAFCVQDSTT
ncbi:MAG: CBS domain-containing protein [Acidobacteria bacterium]|nr:CBS domain-containing protein [Acidobacteriota bacterium]